PAQLPDALTPLVGGLVSLSDIHPRPMMVHALPPMQQGQREGARANALPQNTTVGGAYDIGPQDFYTIYNEGPLLSSGITGSGITVALLEETDINTADVTNFRTTFAVSPSTPSLTVSHGAGSVTCSDPGVTSTDEEGEAVLDTEWAGAVAPGATLLYMSCASTTTAGIFLSAEAVIDNNLATTMSLSYGNTEVGNSATGTFVSNLWEQAAAQGQTVVVSAGDAGSANTQDQNKPIATHGLAVNVFASTAYNVAAGGTDFQDYYNDLELDVSYGRLHYWSAVNGAGLSSALGYIAETTWNDTCAGSILSFYLEASTDPSALCSDALKRTNYEATSGGGGGVSILQARPSWQSSTVYGIPAAGGAYNHRLLPDISFVAANGFWGHALDYYQSDTSTSLQRAGGTSFVAPQLAGLFALIAQKTGERLGQPDYVLYNMAGTAYGTAAGSYLGASCNGSGTASNTGTTSSTPSSSCIFYDVFTGNISQACRSGTNNCYVASGNVGILSTSTTSAQVAYPSGQGFDLATGIGSANIANLVNNWQNAAAGGIAYTPAVSVSATASSYTYGLPSSISYTATVSGSGSFPTGSVNFSGSGAIGAIGNSTLAASSGCASGGTCTETAAKSYTPPATLAGGSYTITATYLTTNENYASGSGTTSLTVTKQTPSVTVSAVSIGSGTKANLSATISYSGSGSPPSGGLTFQVDSGAIVTATCTGASSPLSCTYTGYDSTALSIGSHTITAVSLADTNYATASGTATLTVITSPTITFSVPSHHTQDRSFTVSATSNSTGAITYSVVSGPATIAGTTVTLTGAAGTVVLQASQAAASPYAAGTQNASFQVIAGSAWFANSTGSLSTLDLTGAAITGSGGYSGAGEGSIAHALGVAFDASGNAWIASAGGVSEFTRQGIAVTTTAITAGGIASPAAIAVDGAGQVWVANSNGSVSVLTNTGAAVSPSAGYTAAAGTPSGIAIDISGSVWVPSSTGNTVTRVLGAAAPVVPLSTAASSGAGVRP
ncbi:MAG TPA: hypothetical protein VG714_07340, partial [Acidobacteriaceae bacterium]|nr:hypothetical protein [Acidobacteriaceae bacterium]